MAEGHKRDEHLAAAHDGKEAARMKVLQYLNKNWGGEWYLVSAIKSSRKGAKAGEMNRDVGAKAGEPLRSKNHAWCFAQGINTYTNKQVKAKFLPTGGLD
jgi:hypothetical protein